MAQDPSHHRDGFSHNLEPVYSVDVAKHGSVDALLRELTHTAFGARSLGEAAVTMEQMIKDPDCYVVLTVAGAMTVAKMGLVICEMIDRGWVQAVVATGALMTHGLVEGYGRTHFKYDPRMNDTELYDYGYDRVYDTLELEENLDYVDEMVQQVLERFADDEVMCSRTILRTIGQHLDETMPKDARAILKSCYRMNVPVFVPAFTDSEMGLDVEVYNQVRMQQGKPRKPFNPFLDLEHYGVTLEAQKVKGIFTIGGGVPRNWAQQVGPLVDHLSKRSGTPKEACRFKYGVRVCPEPVHWGGLSGCTYSEGISWGKFIPAAEGGRFTEVLCDATIAWPFLVRGLIERMGSTAIRKLLPRPV